MKVVIRRVNIEEKFVLRQLLELYSYDFSQYLNTDVDKNGFYGYKYLDHYWEEEGRHAFFIVVDEEYAGFVLINRHLQVLEKGNSIAEFFIMKKYRRQGIGKQVAFQIFNSYPGPWEISMIPENKPSVLFWRAVLNDFTNDIFHMETKITDGNEKLFITFKS